jgi:hypothetical protein
MQNVPLKGSQTPVSLHGTTLQMTVIFRGKSDIQNSTLDDMKTTGVVDTHSKDVRQKGGRNGHVSGYKHKREKVENHESIE